MESEFFSMEGDVHSHCVAQAAAGGMSAFR